MDTPQEVRAEYIEANNGRITKIAETINDITFTDDSVIKGVKRPDSALEIAGLPSLEDYAAVSDNQIDAEKLKQNDEAALQAMAEMDILGLITSSAMILCANRYNEGIKEPSTQLPLYSTAEYQRMYRDTVFGQITCTQVKLNEVEELGAVSQSTIEINDGVITKRLAILQIDSRILSFIYNITPTESPQTIKFIELFGAENVGHDFLRCVTGTYRDESEVTEYLQRLKDESVDSPDSEEKAVLIEDMWQTAVSAHASHEMTYELQTDLPSAQELGNIAEILEYIKE